MVTTSEMAKESALMTVLLKGASDFCWTNIQQKMLSQMEEGNWWKIRATTLTSKLISGKEKISHFCMNTSSKNLKTAFNFVLALIYSGDRYSIVDIVTRERLNDPGIESWWRQDFLCPSRPAPTPTQPPAQWVPGLFQG